MTGSDGIQNCILNVYIEFKKMRKCRQNMPKDVLYTRHTGAVVHIIQTSEHRILFL